MARAFQFSYDSQNVNYTPGRGFVVLRVSSDRYIPALGRGHDDAWHDQDHDPDMLESIEIALFDRTVQRGSGPTQINRDIKQVDTLKYDHITETIHFTEQGKYISTKLEEADVRRWLNAVYPNLEPELADSLSAAIPIALGFAPTVDTSLELRRELYALDPLFDQSGSSAATVYANHNPWTLRFPVWYAVVTFTITLLILFFLGRPWFRSILVFVMNWRAGRVLKRF